MQYNEIEKKLKKQLKAKRFEHTLNVVESAIHLAKKYDEDIQKSRYAALLHDCAKNYSSEQLITVAKEAALELDEVTMIEPQLLHGPVGAVVASREYGITDKEILNAIAYHTTGRAGMQKLEKIIYLADFIEPNRHYPGVDTLRELAFIDLDQAMIQALSNTVRYIAGIGGLIHERTIIARNDLILKEKRRNHD